MEIQRAVARNLKALRESKKLSLEAAAKLTGVSKSMLGQIERGEVNPTISVLWKIANGLKVSVSALLEFPQEEVDLVKKENIAPIRTAEGRYLNYPIFPFTEQRRFETYRIEILPGVTLKAEPHLPGAEEYITIFAGNVDILVDDTVYHLNNGDSLRFWAHVPHAYQNPGKVPAVLSMIIHYTQ